MSALDALKQSMRTSTGVSPFATLSGTALARQGSTYDKQRRDAYYSDAIAGATDPASAANLQHEYAQADARAVGDPWSGYSGIMSANTDAAAASGKRFGATGGSSMSAGPLGSLRKVVSGGSGDDDPNLAAREALGFNRWQNEDAETQADRMGNDANSRAIDLLRKQIQTKDEGDVMYGDQEATRARNRGVLDMGAKADELSREFMQPGAEYQRQEAHKSALDLTDARYAEPAAAKDASTLELQSMKNAAAKEIATLRAGGQGNAAAIAALGRIIDTQRTTGADTSATTQQFNEKIGAAPTFDKPTEDLIKKGTDSGYSRDEVVAHLKKTGIIK